MRHLGRALVVATALAAPAAAVDVTGTWSICLSGGGFSCPITMSPVLTSTGGQFTLTFGDQPFPCVITGTVDEASGVLTVDSAAGCAGAFGGMSATATDTTITGTLSFLLCPEYTLTGVPVCGTCDDGNACTADGCGATACSAPSSSCTPAPFDGTPCDDGLACTIGDFCVQGTCTSAPVVCGDGNLCTNDMCDPVTGQCLFVPNAAPCNDGNPCTTNDTCADATCVGGPALACAPCERCGPLVGCVVGPVAGCRRSTTPAKSKLTLRTTPGGGKDKLAWTWTGGAATTAAELGDPGTGDDYTLCVFDAGAVPSRRLLLSTAPHGGTCEGGTSCWRGRGNPPGTKAWVYRDVALLLPDGLKSVKLTPGAEGRARAKVRGRGPELGLPAPLDVTLPLTVQLQGTNGACFESVYSSALVEREDLFRAAASE